MSELLPTADTLSRWLRSSGALPCGLVTRVEVDLEHNTPISRLLFVTATYTADAPHDLPRSLVVKSPLVRVGDNSELRFHREVGPLLPSPPLARCVATVEDGEVIVIE